MRIGKRESERKRFTFEFKLPHNGFSLCILAFDNTLPTAATPSKFPI